MPVKRAHMLTRAYLAAWANDRGKVFVADAESNRGGVRSLSDATVVSYAYRTEITNLDLEAEYGEVESDAVPAIKNLAAGGSITSDGRAAVVRFLDMFSERGRWADQAAVRMPVAVMASNYPEGVRMAEMGLGDRMVLSRHKELGANGLQLADLGIARWAWRIAEVESGLLTGDGAVLAVRPDEEASINTVCFPLSPTRLLIIGEGFGRTAVSINALIVSQCRRWLLDRPDGSYALGWVP